MTWPCRWAASRMLALDSCQSPDGWSSPLCGEDPGSDGCAWPFFQVGETEAQDTQPSHKPRPQASPWRLNPSVLLGAWPRQRLSLEPALGTLPSIFLRLSPLAVPASRQRVQPFGSEV